MGKYIIDVPDEGKYRLGQTYIFTNDGERIAVSCNLTDLTPYTESDREAIEDEVWAFAKKVRLRSFFDDNHNLQPYLDYFDSYQEAKAKHEELKKFENEIRVGDEVEYSCLGGTHRFVVFGVESTIVGNTAYGFKYPCDYDDVGEYCDIDMLTKTGRHFPEVAELLKKMKKESHK